MCVYIYCQLNRKHDKCDNSINMFNVEIIYFLLRYLQSAYLIWSTYILRIHIFKANKYVQNLYMFVYIHTHTHFFRQFKLCQFKVQVYTCDIYLKNINRNLFYTYMSKIWYNAHLNLKRKITLLDRINSSDWYSPREIISLPLLSLSLYFYSKIFF